jgi:hypothetical protein
MPSRGELLGRGGEPRRSRHITILRTNADYLPERCAGPSRPWPRPTKVGGPHQRLLRWQRRPQPEQRCGFRTLQVPMSAVLLFHHHIIISVIYFHLNFRVGTEKCQGSRISLNLSNAVRGININSLHLCYPHILHI